MCGNLRRFPHTMKTPLQTRFILISALLAATASAAAPSLLPGGSEKWALVWQDEFDYPDAELDTHWNSQNGPSGHILCSRWRENAKVSDGTLKLVNRKQKRGGQNWTSGSIITKKEFQYGYLECRYKYAAAEGTNNSFWLMTRGPDPQTGKRFEIDINEGHFPNEVNTNIHNWSDIKVVNGKKTHPSSSRSFPFGVRPDVTVQLEIPVTTRRIRFSSNNANHFHLGELRIYQPNAAGFPAPFSKTADKDKPGLVNVARLSSTKIIANGHYQPDGAKILKHLTDGDPATTWVTRRNGAKQVEFIFAKDTTIGCVQFLNGWKSKGKWSGLANDYKIEYHDGQKWVEMSSFDLAKGSMNLARDFHTYGLEWSEKELVFYFDGKELRREKNGFCHSPSPVWLSLAIIAWAGKITDAIDGTAMEVDYVRVYQRK
jgi:beta-glucanase (GH16 family)